MTLDQLRKFCSKLPHVTEDVKWGNDLCFLIAEKMFCVASLDPREGNRVSFKCTPEQFALLEAADPAHEQPGGDQDAGEETKQVGAELSDKAEEELLRGWRLVVWVAAAGGASRDAEQDDGQAAGDAPEAGASL